MDCEKCRAPEYCCVCDLMPGEDYTKSTWTNGSFKIRWVNNDEVEVQDMDRLKSRIITGGGRFRISFGMFVHIRNKIMITGILLAEEFLNKSELVKLAKIVLFSQDIRERSWNGSEYNLNCFESAKIAVEEFHMTNV